MVVLPTLTHGFHKGEFDGALKSKFVSDLNGKNDEIHVIVIDQDGLITGTPDTVLETFPFLSVAKNAKRADGTSNFYKDVLRLQSDWVYAGRLHTGDSMRFQTLLAQTGILMQ